MSDDRIQLRATLDQLKAQLNEAQGLPPRVSERLRATISDVEKALAGPTPARAGEHSLTNRLSEIALDFEASHPTLSGNLGSVIDALAQMGI